MKLILVITFIISFAASLISAQLGYPPYDLHVADVTFKLFAKFYNKTYVDEYNRNWRFGIFKKTLEYINWYKEIDPASPYDINENTDLLNYEIQGPVPPTSPPGKIREIIPDIPDIFAAFLKREEGKIYDLKEQMFRQGVFSKYLEGQYVFQDALIRSQAYFIVIRSKVYDMLFDVKYMDETLDEEGVYSILQKI